MTKIARLEEGSRFEALAAAADEKEGSKQPIGSQGLPKNAAKYLPKDEFSWKR